MGGGLRLFILRVMTSGVGAGSLVKTFDVMNEAHVACDIVTSRRQIVRPEVPLALEVNELGVDALFRLLRREGRYVLV